jgi:hypothetical protein
MEEIKDESGEPYLEYYIGKNRRAASDYARHDKMKKRAE